ncbi:hypothetical protein L2725_06900 [Shewanella corallii]|uniref:Uncharacterized protein n=1 Tax=Shewanella corallii TaxID=560080 RepID=A0ABT0N6K7_9GAMM|nr:hypothetical protein [Shewanella corallii]MCL2913516.1 hypothetical protein [Shewanella corallii]
MILAAIFGLIWLVLMVRASLTEYRYWQVVRHYEPEIWEKLGRPRMYQMPLVFLSSKNAKLLQSSRHEQVQRMSARHRLTGIQFLSYVVLMLVCSISYFKLAL